LKHLNQNLFNNLKKSHRVRPQVSWFDLYEAKDEESSDQKSYSNTKVQTLRTEHQAPKISQSCPRNPKPDNLRIQTKRSSEKDLVYKIRSYMVKKRAVSVDRQEYKKLT
jgi:hypothetical protein